MKIPKIPVPKELLGDFEKAIEEYKRSKTSYLVGFKDNEPVYSNEIKRVYPDADVLIYNGD